MKIIAVHTNVRHFAIRPQVRIISHAGTHDHSCFLHIIIEDDEGNKGYGEAALTALWSGETAQTADVMVKEIIRAVLLQKTFDHPSETSHLLEKTIYGNSFLKGAIDCAIWDLFGRSQGLSVATMIKNRALPISLPSRASIGMYPVRETVAAAKYFWEAGIRTLKFKTGLSGSLDKDRLRAVRAELGYEPSFTVDYNGRFSNSDEALSSIHVLSEFGIQYVEQPTHRESLSLLAKVRRGSPIPIIADEAIFSPMQLEEAIRLEACDVVCLYPGKCGGFSNSITMAQRCQEVGLPCVGGSNLETDLGSAATLSLVASQSIFPHMTIPGDYANGLYYLDGQGEPALSFSEGNTFLPEGPGFGVSPHTNP